MEERCELLRHVRSALGLLQIPLDVGDARVEIHQEAQVVKALLLRRWILLRWRLVDDLRLRLVDARGDVI